MAKYNFLDLEKIDPRKADVVVWPFGFEATTSYGGGTDRGPEAILKSSLQVEWFDEESWSEPCQKFSLATLPLVSAKSIKQAQAKIEKAIGQILDWKKFPLTLGGEHSITPLIIETFAKKGFKDFSILQFDAHADLRDGYQGHKYSHAAAMRRCLDNPSLNLVQVGIRNISSDESREAEFWEKNQDRVKTFWAKDKKDWKLEEIVKNLKENVYITFDVDAFDSSLMPATGTPEPGGIFWDEALGILRAVCKSKKIIGADFVELAPIKGLHAPDFLVAKLIYKTLGYIFNK